MLTQVHIGLAATNMPSSFEIDLNTHGSYNKINKWKWYCFTWSNFFRSLIWKRLYLTHSRPDICFVVCRLSQHLATPTETHLQATMHIIQYLKNSYTFSLFFIINSTMQLTGFSNLVWGTFPITRRSTTSFCFYFGSYIVSWKSKKQQVLSCLSSETEYRALANASYEA